MVKTDGFGVTTAIAGGGSDMHLVVIGAGVDLGVQGAIGGDGVSGVAASDGVDAQFVSALAGAKGAVVHAVGGIKGASTGDGTQINFVVTRTNIQGAVAHGPGIGAPAAGMGMNAHGIMACCGCNGGIVESGRFGVATSIDGTSANVNAIVVVSRGNRPSVHSGDGNRRSGAAVALEGTCDEVHD